PARQAAAMYDLIQRNGAAYVQGLYANKGAVNDIIRAYNSGGGRNGAINAMTRVIENQVSNGTYISSHLRSRAVDISTGANLAVLRDVVRQMGGSVLNEGDHYHVQL
ncbi:MAG: hypothetical protein H7Z37_02555, partial [Pyrinomonadaceae bacterium]|nr:hypothetical protein [Pyrinomonadaceae bacterium]